MKYLSWTQLYTDQPRTESTPEFTTNQLIKNTTYITIQPTQGTKKMQFLMAFWLDAKESAQRISILNKKSEKYTTNENIGDTQPLF